MDWQELKEMGLNIYKKTPRSRTLWIGGSVSLLTTFMMIAMLTGVTVVDSGNQICDTECISYVNITSTYWEICFDDNIELIHTIPKAKVEVYILKGNEWKLFDTSIDCIKRKNAANPHPNQLKIVGYKKPGETVKWWSNPMKIPDPIWSSGNISLVYNYDTTLNSSLGLSEQFKPNWSEINWSNIFNSTIILSGNYSWNHTFTDVTTLSDYTYNFTNNGTINITVQMNLTEINVSGNINVTCNNTLLVNNTYINITDLPMNTTQLINCTLDLENINQTFTEWVLTTDNAYWFFNVSIKAINYT